MRERGGVSLLWLDREGITIDLLTTPHTSQYFENMLPVQKAKTISDDFLQLLERGWDGSKSNVNLFTFWNIKHNKTNTEQMKHGKCVTMFHAFLGRKLLQNEPGGQTQKFSTFGFGTGEASLTHHSKIKFLIVFNSLLFWSFILSYTIQRELYVRKTINKNMIIFKWTSIEKSQPFCASKCAPTVG